MERIYQQAKDKNVAAAIIYGKANETKAYADSGCTVQMKTSELKEAFLKRAVIKIGEAYFIPAGYAEAESVGTVTYAKAGTTAGTAATATLVSVKD